MNSSVCKLGSCGCNECELAGITAGIHDSYYSCLRVRRLPAYLSLDLETAGVYRFTVEAENSIGFGAVSAITDEVLLVVPPGPPTALRVIRPISDNVTVSWTQPLDDGGAPITGYEVQVGRSADLSSAVDRRDVSLAVTAAQRERATYTGYFVVPTQIPTTVWWRVRSVTTLPSGVVYRGAWTDATTQTFELLPLGTQGAGQDGGDGSDSGAASAPSPSAAAAVLLAVCVGILQLLI